MKQCLFLFIAVMSLYACNEPATKEAGNTPTVDSPKTEAATVTYPYTPNYSSKFEISNPEHVKMLLDLWKHWDNNTLGEGAGFFADSVTMQFHDGTKVHGSRDSIIAMGKRERGKFTRVTSSVDACVALRSTDKDEEWVCIWGKEINETAKGKIDSLLLQENWRLDKNGKVVELVQFAAKPWKNQ
jgi:hypothetical protein